MSMVALYIVGDRQMMDLALNLPRLWSLDLGTFAIQAWHLSKLSAG